MAAKSTQERFDALEKSVKFYRLMVIVLFFTILLIERARVVSWVDTFEQWMKSL